MATVTLGTSANNSLTALPFNPMAAAADMASIMGLIKAQSAFGALFPSGYWAQSGRLHFPGRKGFVNLLPGDYVAVDSNGWPVVVSSQSIAAGGTSWVHT